jgi:DNA-binding NtrC family response regulator
VLFVDDEPSIRMTLPLILQDRGFSVSTASDVAEALSEIERGRFDVLISDLNIGGEADGLEVLGAMRQAQPQCVTIVLTGFPSFETAVEGIRVDVDDYLVKPVDIDYLVDTMKKNLSSRLGKSSGSFGNASSSRAWTAYPVQSRLATSRCCP